jgi:DNA-binding response OmpR family regulator
LTREGVSLKLKPIGYKLLGILVKGSPQVFSRKKLEAMLWGDLPPDSDVLRTHIHSLRQVINKPFNQSMIKTVQGMGYCMVNPNE